jgi:prophage maintenance system killer protein
MNDEVKKTTDHQIEFYQTADGETGIDVRLEDGTVWLTPGQMAEVFDTTSRNVRIHLGNIFDEGELSEAATRKDFFLVRLEGKREVKREVTHYSLDAVISVGYRVNSKQGVQFRIWATKRLNDYLVKGVALNHERFDKNSAELQQALALIQKASSSADLSHEAGRGLVQIVSRYTQTFLWLQRYDEGLLDEPKGQPGGTLLSPRESMADLNALKADLMASGDATDLFALPREDGLVGIFGNLEQSVFGEPAYPSIESKAAHLLYFVVKNHPFSDGNKRSGAFLFVDFLHRNGRLLNARSEPTINDVGLAALTLLVAESDPKQKDVMIRLIMNMLARST